MTFWRRRRPTRCNVVIVDDVATKHAMERAKADRLAALADLEEMKERTRRSILEREKNHFAPTIRKALESSRGKKAE